MKLLITGGAGFIGAHVLHHFCKTYPEYDIYCLDSLSYAAQYEHIEELEAQESFNFIKADLNDAELLHQLFTGIGFTHIIHLAAESHVDNSISDPLVFARTNVMGFPCQHRAPSF